MFDIAVTATEENNISGGGGVKVAILNIGGGSEHSKLNESISRIKFYISAHQYIT